MWNKNKIPGSLLPLALCLSMYAFSQASSDTDFKAVSQSILNNPDPQDWLMWRGGYENWGYSSLTEINRENVDRIRLAWSWEFAPAAPGSNGMQIEPTVYDGVIYLSLIHI